MQAVTDLGALLGLAASCAALGLPKATCYRWLKPRPPPAKRASHRALAPDERRAVLDVLHEPRLAEFAPAEVYATLLDEGRYLAPADDAARRPPRQRRRPPPGA